MNALSDRLERHPVWGVLMKAIALVSCLALFWAGLVVL